MREELVRVGAGKGEKDETGREPCAGMGFQGIWADWLGSLGLCYGLQTDCSRLAVT